MKKVSFGVSRSPRPALPHFIPLHYLPTLPRAISGALRKYEETRSNGNSSHKPLRPMPADGSFILLNPNMAQSEWATLRYNEGPGDDLWMVEKDRNFLAGGGDPHSLKKATFGDSDNEVWIPPWEALADFMDKRANGTNSDNPPRLLPIDGQFSWVDPNTNQSKVRYYAGPEDKKWMEERDRNYIARLEREGRLEQVEPNLRRECPELYAEIMAVRAQEKRTSQNVALSPQRGSSSANPPDPASTTPPAPNRLSEKAQEEIRSFQVEKLKDLSDEEISQLEQACEAEEERLTKEDMQETRLQQEERERLAKEAQERSQREQAEKAHLADQLRLAQQKAEIETAARQKAEQEKLRLQGANRSIIPFADLTYGRLLGKGTYAEVFLGTWQHTEIAIKQFLAPRLSQAATTEMDKEYAIMWQLHHPNVIQIFGICEEPGHYSLVMEYMSKGSLYSVLHSQEDMSWPLRWNIAINIGKGICHLHQHKPPILHRDLKSLNVLLDAHYSPKITDFGLAKVRTETRNTTMATQKSVGTTPWMAPELFSLRPAFSEASDVYALGMILWELAARKDPYADIDPQVIISSVKAGEREEIPADVPATFARLIARCWTQRREDRPRIGEIVQELEQHISEAPQPTPTLPTIPEAYICPITSEIMQDPVVDREGHSFERTAIADWIGRQHNCPVSRAPLELTDLAPNRALHEAIEAFLAANPVLRPAQTTTMAPSPARPM